LGSAAAASILRMPEDHVFDGFDLLAILQGSKFDHLLVAPSREITCFIHDISDSAGHSRSEIAASFSQHNNTAASHIFAAMVAHGLDHSVNPAVAHAKTLAGDAVNVGFAAGGAVEGDVTDDYVLFGNKHCFPRGVDDD